MKTGDIVKVKKIHRDTMTNMWGTPINLKPLLGQKGKIEVSYTDGSYGIEFDEDEAYGIRRMTGVLFYADDLEVEK